MPHGHQFPIHCSRSCIADFSNAEWLALAGFLAGYSGLTRQAYELDLRQYASWCQQHHVRPFSARRADIECFARDLQSRGRAPATITRWLSTISGFYRHAVEELLNHPPAAHVRRPCIDYESHAVSLERDELGALLVAAGLGPATEHALISLLALTGLRVFEATGASIEAMGIERGHPGRRRRFQQSFSGLINHYERAVYKARSGPVAELRNPTGGDAQDPAPTLIAGRYLLRSRTQRLVQMAGCGSPGA